MEFVRFLNNRQQEVFSRQREEHYNAWADGEVSAIVACLAIYRFAFRCLLIPKVLIHYACVKTGWARAPRPALEEKQASDEALKAKVAQDLKRGKPQPRRYDA